MLLVIKIFILFCIFIILGIGLLLLIYNHYEKEQYFNYVGKKIVKNKLNHPRWTKFVDKSKFKDLCSKLGIKTLDSLYELDKLSQIDSIYDKLPKSFIVKSNKGSGRNLIVKDKNNWTPKQIKKKMKHYNDKYPVFPINLILYEPQYNYTKGKLIFEELIQPVPMDIKVMVYKNSPTIFWINNERKNRKETKTIFRINEDFSVEKLNCTWESKLKSSDPNDLPFDFSKQNIKKMCDLTMKLAKEVPLELVRIDFMYINNDFYGGEITLTSAGYNNKRIGKECQMNALRTQNVVKYL